jgi:hypothetical protein
MLPGASQPGESGIDQGKLQLRLQDRIAVTLPADIADQPLRHHIGLQPEDIDIDDGVDKTETAWPAKELGIVEIALVGRFDQQGVDIAGTVPHIDIDAGKPAKGRDTRAHLFLGIAPAAQPGVSGSLQTIDLVHGASFPGKHELAEQK